VGNNPAAMITAKVSQLIYGGDFNAEPWPESVWVEDVALMRRASVNLVTVGAFSWSSLQPNPDTYTFDWLDRVIALLHENEIFIGLATGTGSPPPWFAHRHPESLTVSGADGRPRYCPNSPCIANTRRVWLANSRPVTARTRRWPSGAFTPTAPRITSCAGAASAPHNFVFGCNRNTKHSPC